MLKDTYPDCPIYLHEAEKEWPHRPDLNASRLLMHDDIIAPDADDFYKIRYNYEISGFNFRILETPGHSIGGVSLVFDQEKKSFLLETRYLKMQSGVGTCQLEIMNNSFTQFERSC